MLKDLQFAWRTLRGGPLFAVIAVLSLALGIGGSTAIFSVVVSSLLRGLPYPESGQLVELLVHQPCCNLTPISPGEYFDYARQSKSLSGLAAFVSKSGTLSGSADPKKLNVSSVTTNFFDVLRAQPEMGRLISPPLDKPGADTRVAVLSDATWRSIFGAAKSIVGKYIALDSRSFRVVGVLKSNQQYPSETQIFVSPRIDVPENQEGLVPKGIHQQYGNQYMETVGRLRPGFTVRQSEAELKTISASIAAQNPEDRGFYARLIPFQTVVVGNVRLAIITLLIGVTLLLLIACANIAGLLLARATGRTREIAVRVALGARGRDIVRLLFSESILLSVFSGALGIAFADVGIRLLIDFSPSNLPGVLVPELNTGVLAFCAGVTFLSLVMIGLFPALRATKPDLQASLKEGSRGTSSGGTHRLRRMLIGAEFAISVTLLVGVSLLTRSFWKLINVNPGFDAQHVISAHISLPEGRYQQGTQVDAYWHDLLSKLDALPEVSSAGLLFNPPMAESSGIGAYLQIEGQPSGPGHLGPHVELHVVSGDTFATMRIPLLQGRTFSERDNANSPPVSIINKRFAEQYFANLNPIGQRFIFPGPSYSEIIGVVGDVKYHSLDEKSELNFYVDYAQSAQNSMNLLLRPKANSGISVAELRSVVRSLDPNVPLSDVRTLGDYLGRSLVPRKFLLGLLTVFSGLGIFLAAIGLYAALAFSVQQRKQEIGIRVALGANSGNVLWLILRECLTITIIGTGIGLFGATWTTSFLKSMLYGISDTDLISYAAAIILTMAIAIATALVPALRATRIDPLSALRYE